MAQERDRLAEAEADRIYFRRIRPDLLDDIPASSNPTAVVVGGQPGAGRPFTLARVRAHLNGLVGPAVTISGDELREYHPYWLGQGRIDPQAAQRTQSDTGMWYARLTNDGIAKGANLIFDTSMRQPESVAKLAQQLRSAGYQVAAVVLAVERDMSRQATLNRYEVGRSAGEVPRFVSEPEHDGAYVRLRDTVARLDKEHVVDRIQLVTRDGRQLYANQADQGQWRQAPKALATLDDFRERRLPARELADNALRWQTLAQRLAGDPSVPREVAAQAVAWRNEAMQNAERDPDARQLMQWGREAEAFRTMDRHQFAREFPQHAKMAERLDEAITYAESNFGHAVDREKFVIEARERIADRIAEGQSAVLEKAPERSQQGRAR